MSTIRDIMRNISPLCAHGYNAVNDTCPMCDADAEVREEARRLLLTYDAARDLGDDRHAIDAADELAEFIAGRFGFPWN